MTKKVLLVGESWTKTTIHVKGFDSFVTSEYETGEEFIRGAFEQSEDYEYEHMPAHIAMEEFPYDLEGLKKYDLIILSDIGANSLLLPNRVFTKSEKTANRCNLIKEYVLDGGALLMIGGYMTFSGINAAGKWQDTAVQDVLPVKILSTDDRIETPEGVYPKVVKDHEIFEGVEKEWPHVLGYNKTILKEDGELLATVNEDPFIAVGSYGKGKSVVFTSDSAPHWAPPEFVNWKSYNKLFVNIADYLTK